MFVIRRRIQRKPWDKIPCVGRRVGESHEAPRTANKKQDEGEGTTVARDKMPSDWVRLGWTRKVLALDSDLQPDIFSYDPPLPHSDNMLVLQPHMVTHRHIIACRLTRIQSSIYRRQNQDVEDEKDTPLYLRNNLLSDNSQILMLEKKNCHIVSRYIFNFFFVRFIVEFRSLIICWPREKIVNQSCDAWRPTQIPLSVLLVSTTDLQALEN